MGSVGVGSELSVDQYIQELWHVCLSIDVPYSVYWHGTHEDLDQYLKAYIIKRDRARLEFESQAWIMGLYVARAFNADDKKNPYPDQPIEFYPTKEREIRKELEKEELIKRTEQQEIAMLLDLFSRVKVTER